MKEGHEDGRWKAFSDWGKSRFNVIALFVTIVVVLLIVVFTQSKLKVGSLEIVGGSPQMDSEAGRQSCHECVQDCERLLREFPMKREGTCGDDCQRLRCRE